MLRRLDQCKKEFEDLENRFENSKKHTYELLAAASSTDDLIANLKLEIFEKDKENKMLRAKITDFENRNNELATKLLRLKKRNENLEKFFQVM